MFNYDNIHNQIVRRNILDMYIIEKGAKGSGIKGHQTINQQYLPNTLFLEIKTWISNQGHKLPNKAKFISNVSTEIQRRSKNKYSFFKMHKNGQDDLIDQFLNAKLRGRNNS